MDIKKLQEIIDKSDLSEPAKELIQDLMPEADKPEIQAEILKTIDYEIKMYGLAADEAEAIVDQLRAAEIRIVAAYKFEDDELKELSEKYEDKMAEAENEMKKSLQYKDNLIKELSQEEAGDTVSAPTEAVAPQAQAPVAPVDPVAPTIQATQPVQNPGYGGQQYNAAPQPAAFPTAPVMEQV